MQRGQKCPQPHQPGPVNKIYLVVTQVTYESTHEGRCCILRPSPRPAPNRLRSKAVSQAFFLADDWADDPSAYITGLQQPAWIFDQQTLSFLHVNQAAIEQYGFGQQQFMRMTILDIRPVQEIPRVLQEVLHPYNRGPRTNERWRHMRKNGQVFLAEITSREITFQGRRAEVVVAVPVGDVVPIPAGVGKKRPVRVQAGSVAVSAAG